MRVTLYIALILLMAQVACADKPRIEQTIEPGQPVTPALTRAYEPERGQRFVVNETHQIPDDMVVQGDTVRLRVVGVDPATVEQARWTLSRKCGHPWLTTDEGPLVAAFLADGYGENIVTFDAIVEGEPLTLQANIDVEFSTHNVLISGQHVAMPDDHETNPFVHPYSMPITNHREPTMARNPHTGRLVMLWQVKFEVGPDDGPMGVGVMVSDDHGITWADPRFLYIEHPNNSGWGTIAWNPAGNDGRGEFLAFTCSHVRSPDNRFMLFRSRDDGRTWQSMGDHQDSLVQQFGRENALLNYFGVNRMVVTKQGTIVAPMISNYFVRTAWSDDNGQTWHASNLDDSFPKGNENAIIETLDGDKLILFARPHDRDIPHNHRFESRDGGKSWTDEGHSTIPTAIVNVGLARIDDPGKPYHGRVLHANAATRTGPHTGRQRTVVSINDDPIEVDPARWDMRLLWDARANYTDVLYLPEDRSILVTIETIQPGRESPLGYESIRGLKMSYRYWQNLPTYVPE